MKKHRRWVISVGALLVLATALSLASCGMNASPSSIAPGSGGAVPSSAARQDFSSAQQGNVTDVLSKQGQAEAQQPLQNRIVLKNATLSMTVDDPGATITTISKLATDLSGWVVTSNTYQRANSAGSKQSYGNITVRVPAEKLDSALEQIKASAVSVDSLNVTGEDVTEQYTDLNSQLTNLQTAQDDLRKIMDSATKTQDVLAVYQELSNIRGQIDVIQGKLKFYDQSAAYSSIAVTLSPSADSTPIQIGGWQPGSTLKSAVEALVHLLQGLVDLLIWLIIVVLPFAIVLYVAYRIFRRFWPRTATPTVSVPPPTGDETSQG